jgi:polar amino acid transport system ATP-binding protein
MIAALPMYDTPALAEANDRFWALIRDHLRDAGHPAPDGLIRGVDDLWSIWTAPDLILAQTCGFPYRARLHAAVTLVGTPDYGIEGCAPGQYRSVLVTRANDRRIGIASLAGAAMAVNETLSQSGWAAPASEAAALGLRLRPAVRTGSHRGSASAVLSGHADWAAIEVIEIRDLHKSYGALEVLKGVDLVAPRGHVVSLIGSSGSGKSTLLRCCNLLEDSQQGEIRFEGEPVRWRGSGQPPPGRQGAGHPHPHQPAMVFQQFNLWAHMTVLQNVMEAPLTVLRQPRDEVEARARALLDKVGIGDKADVYPAQMSGGQQQRAAIARALCMEPRALLFDEPTSALDPELEQEVVKVIKALAEEGRTMLLVTHDMRLAADVSDHVIFLHQGRIEEEGPPDRLFGAPQTDRLRGFLRTARPPA